MPFIHYATKQAARKARRIWLLGVAEFEVVARILAGIPQGHGGSALCDVIAIAMGYLAVEANGVAEDPARPDFVTQTRARPRSLPLESLGNSPLEQSAATFAGACTQAASLLSAFVRSIERAEGAQEAGAIEFQTHRLSDAGLYAPRGASALSRVSELGQGLAESFESDRDLRRQVISRFEGAEGRLLLETPFWEKLSPKTRELFRESRFDPRALARDWPQTWPRDPVQSSALTLTQAMVAAREMSLELQEWRPSDE